MPSDAFVYHPNCVICSACVTGEENVTMLDDKHYNQENILIHEFAHSVMCIGMDDEQRKSICAAYQEAAHSGLYQMHIYMMANADEYWAEATQSWFDATIRTGNTWDMYGSSQVRYNVTGPLKLILPQSQINAQKLSQQHHIYSRHMTSQYFRYSTVTSGCSIDCGKPQALFITGEGSCGLTSNLAQVDLLLQM